MGQHSHLTLCGLPRILLWVHILNKGAVIVFAVRGALNCGNAKQLPRQSPVCAPRLILCRRASSCSRHRRAKQRARTRRAATGAAGLLVLAIIWQLAAMLANSIFLPSVTQTIQTFAHYIDRPYPSQGSPLWLDAVVSLRRILLGFAIGAAAGIVLGAAMSASRVARHLIDPVIEVLRPLSPCCTCKPGPRCPGSLPACGSPWREPGRASSRLS